MMKANAAPMSVADYCEGMEAGKIIVNHEYQREEGVWSPYARSYFVESILLGYPIPKLFLYTRYDVKTKRSHKEIVDGQQRSHALALFFKNKLRISTKVPTAGLRQKRYKDLDESEQEAFLSYSLSIDEFSGVQEDEIRESFARMNVNNISLNAEELLNAKYQGEFKWFINDLCRTFREDILDAGVVSRRDIVRMADTRVFSDVISILEDGFITTKPTNIESLYRRFDRSFPKQTIYADSISRAFVAWRQFDGGNYPRLARKHIFYTYIVAFIANLDPPGAEFDIGVDARARLDALVEEGITLFGLNEALANAGVHDIYESFVLSCSSKTNVGDQKLTRFLYLSAAIKNEA